ncbi:hypothetical protein [Oceanospirillum beijerinckii]|uniref:hypothetical protein n=1 Tax=Oceanospirillum beijerinckii TaxID=64976 RepID=UPI00040ACBF8|nr:hypothetical protein [Oceanospirillum beijerinckii]
MKLSVEISMYPLAEDFKPPIKAVIAAFNLYPELEVITSATSTQIFGDYDVVMDALKAEMKRSYEQYGRAVFVTKFINGDVRDL